MLKKFDPQRLRVASPCGIAWKDMTGNERVRHCGSCDLNVYNTAEMTHDEINEMIRTREGRLCIRMYRRADGTVITKDCPVGVKAYARRLGRLASASFAAVLALVSASFSQTEQLNVTGSSVKVTRLKEPDRTPEINGRVLDPNGAVIPGVKLLLTGNEVSIKGMSDDSGEFRFGRLKDGTYNLTVEGTWFMRSLITNIRVHEHEAVRVDVAVRPNSESTVVGIFMEEPLIDVTSSTVTTVIDNKKIQMIPH